ncbi:hypothetical protein BU009_13210, partial [Mammaliicoccus sciuri]
MNNKIGFEQWLIKHGYDNYIDIIGTLENANNIYNESNEDEIDFLKNGDKFLELTIKNKISKNIKSALTNLFDESNDDLRATAEYYYDTLNSIIFYYEFLIEKDKNREKKEIENFVIETKLKG